MSEKVDVAINILGKPWQTALSILSLIQWSGEHINKFWLQFEPVGSKFDSLSPYAIVKYLHERGVKYELSQPAVWLACNVPAAETFKSAESRYSIRYEHAFENSKARLLFLMHNDIWVRADIICVLKENMGEAFIIGELGQCWNCPAANEEVSREVMGQGKCTPDNYHDYKPDYQQLCALYRTARDKDIFVRPYDTENFEGEFKKQPWPLPECRVNEWACLIDLEKTRPLSLPWGKAWPPGTFRKCGSFNLDTITPFFRDIHAQGLYAKNVNVRKYLKHWVGTGNKTPGKYAFSEDRAKGLIEKNYPHYMDWLKSAGEKIN